MARKARPRRPSRSNALPEQVEPHRPRPEPTSAEIAHRITKRRDGVAAVCRSPQYVEMLIQVSTGVIPESDVPDEPDPHDLTISKRSWERDMQAWRTKIKGLVGSDDSSGME